jgi:hypothetical protein
LHPFLSHGSNPLDFFTQGVVRTQVMLVMTNPILISNKHSQAVVKSVLTTVEEICSPGLIFPVQELASSYVRRPAVVSIGLGVARGSEHAGSNIN